MTRPAVAIAALLAIAATPPVAEDSSFTLAEGAGFEQRQGEVIAGDADRNKRMTIPVIIEGQGPFRFMIDTGSQATVVSSTLRERLKLPSLGQATVIGMVASKQVELVRLDGLELASRVFDNLHAPTLEAQHIGADGIIGLDSLQDLRVLIDFRAETIAVDDAKALGGDRGYEIVVRARNTKGRLIITDAEIDGVATAVILDTGSQGSMGNLALERRLRAKRGREVTATDVTGTSMTGRLDKARKLVIGRNGARQLSLAGLMPTYSDAPAFAALGLAGKPALVLGVEDLRLFDRIAIDFAERTVLFDLPEGARRSPFARKGPPAPVL